MVNEGFLVFLFPGRTPCENVMTTYWAWLVVNTCKVKYTKHSSKFSSESQGNRTTFLGFSLKNMLIS